ncbi:MAG: NDP-sugar synthase [Armatimonadetes bacterium]|nr:NDP-sugar synthase [Armatimonadota bacterium]
MQAIILAGGRGTRLHPLTMSTPKPMLPLFSKPVMEHCITLLRRHGVDEIIVALSDQAKEIVEHFGDGSLWDVNIRYSVEDEPRGTAGAVKLIQPYISGTFLVVSGDTITDIDLSEAIEFHREKSAIATMLLHQVVDPADYGIVQQEDDGRITRLLEKPRSSEVFSRTVNTGIYVLEPEALSSIPYFTTYDFSRDLFPRMLRNMEPVYGCQLPGHWCDVGNIIEYRNAHFDALVGKAKIDITGAQIEPGVWIGEGADIHHTAELVGPLFLGTGAGLRRNAALRPFAVVGENTLVDEAACVARSIIGSGAFIGKGTVVSDCVVASGYRLHEQRSINNQVIMDEDDQLSIVPGADAPNVRSLAA